MNQFVPLAHFSCICRLLAMGVILAVSAPIRSAETTVVTSYLPPFTLPNDPVRPGFFVDVAKAAFEKAGIPFSIEFQPWARAQANTLARPGLFILGLARTPERDRNYKFVAEIYASNICFLSTRQQGPIDGFDQARELKAVTVRAGTNFETLLRDAGLTNIDLSQTEEQAARKLSRGHVQAWLTYDIGATSMWRNIGAEPADLVISATIQHEGIYLAAAKDTSDEVIQKLHDAVQAIHADGSYDRIFEKYFGSGG